MSQSQGQYLGPDVLKNEHITMEIVLPCMRIQEQLYIKPRPLRGHARVYIVNSMCDCCIIELDG